MNKVKLSELDEAVRDFLTSALQGDGVIVEDDDGQAQGSLLPYCRPTSEQRQRAEASLERLRQKTGDAMRRHGVTEDDIVRVILEDD